MKSKGFIPYKGQSYSAEETQKRAKSYYDYMNARRSLRFFSNKPVKKSVIHDLIMTASSAPSGAHKQPWTFCAIQNTVMKSKIRIAAEKEEYENYHGRMSEDWLEDLSAFGTDWNKEFIDIAPWIIIMLRKSYDLIDGKKSKNYYVQESAGIAAGFLISAIHNAGLVTLTHTPSPMNFLSNLLDRPSNEKPFLLLPVGYPTEDAVVPDLERKKEEEVIIWFD